MRAKLKWSVSVSTLLLLSACDPRWHLIGEGPGPRPPMGSGGVPAQMGPGGAIGAGAGGGSAGGNGAEGGGGAIGSGAAGGAVVTPMPRPLPVGAREAVTKVTRLLWQTAPDAALIAEADSETLATTEDIRQLVLRLQSDPRAHRGIGGFYRWWLDLDAVSSVQKDPSLFPSFNAQLASAMRSETEAFGIYVTLDMNGTFSTLLTAPFSFLNESLAGVYGVAGVVGPALRATTLDPRVRAGLLTQPAFLAANASATATYPIERGIFVRERVLCQLIPDPPPQTSVALPDPVAGSGTQRERLAAETNQPPCTACHRLIDPIGFAYENFDAIGQYRTIDNGLPIDASGTLVAAGVDIPFNGAVDLGGVLAKNSLAQLCMTRKWVEYGLGRKLTAQDEPTVSQAHILFAMSGFNLRQLIAAVAHTPGFLAADAVCTPGAHQTCNDNPAFSSLHGQCTEAARCVCATFGTNPATGRCY